METCGYNKLTKLSQIKNGMRLCAVCDAPLIFKAIRTKRDPYQATFDHALYGTVLIAA